MHHVCYFEQNFYKRRFPPANGKLGLSTEAGTSNHLLSRGCDDEWCNLMDRYLLFLQENRWSFQKNMKLPRSATHYSKSERMVEQPTKHTFW